MSRASLLRSATQGSKGKASARAITSEVARLPWMSDLMHQHLSGRKTGTLRGCFLDHLQAGKWLRLQGRSRPLPSKCHDRNLGSTLLRVRHSLSWTPWIAPPRVTTTPLPDRPALPVAEASASSDPPLTQATRSKRQEREDTLRRFGTLIKQHYGEKYDVTPFGSTCYGASINASDIDVMIVDTDRPYGITPYDERKLPCIYDVRGISKLLYDNGYTNIACIPKASVPIVKFTDPETGMSCDVNVNNRLGVYNTALLRQYCLRAPYLAPYLRRVKQWVNSVGLNNPSTYGKKPSFSSYSITLMTIAYLQSLGHLPNLQADPEAILRTHFWDQRSRMHRKIEISFGACKEWSRPEYLRQPSLKAWLHFFGYEFDWNERVVNIRQGGFTERPAHTPRVWGHVRSPHRDKGNIIVLDPLSDKNCTYPIALSTLQEFKEACVAAYAEFAKTRRATRATDDGEHDDESSESPSS
ncbi:hypothetical protein C8Q77DRAFT_1254711 [Trametes polyzona]|nr:hypothetical protein C8Q77DRAFT_1254711 [Trametes polyzona]